MRIFKTYEMVDAVVKSGSFRKASEIMSITSTALNRRVIALEEDLGVEIFERLPHGVRPTSPRSSNGVLLPYIATTPHYNLYGLGQRRSKWSPAAPHSIRPARVPSSCG